MQGHTERNGGVHAFTNRHGKRGYLPKCHAYYVGFSLFTDTTSGAGVHVFRANATITPFEALRLNKLGANKLVIKEMQRLRTRACNMHT